MYGITASGALIWTGGDFRVAAGDISFREDEAEDA